MHHEQVSFHLPSNSRWASRSLSFSNRIATVNARYSHSGCNCQKYRDIILKSPLAKGIRPGNLSVCGDGTLRVILNSEWKEMLAGLRDIGKVLVISRNGSAVIARYMVYPELIFDQGERKGSDADDQINLDLRWWRFAHARHSRMPNGEGYAIDFHDAHRQSFHSVVLTPDSSMSCLSEWVQKHQMRTECTREETESPARKTGSVDNLPPDLSHHCCRRVLIDRAELLPLLRWMTELAIPIRAVVGHEAIAQGHIFTPRSIRESGSWIFCSDDDTGFHFDLGGVSTVRLDGFELQGHECWALKGFSAEGRLLFFLAPGDFASLNQWNTLLREVADEEC